ncbi:hypothetical protein RAE19_10555 [Rhodoferax sp. TBRC 17660]|uniref:Uncharacterized protein n=1 Tax=Rhodoferax potami TaxID=3068338 RepID=A0ABU3KN51_9BURK|nr:hypothetical protein [Rhodoferax sp. TBRC 17660]MDT7519147.1 hypothetical protein [Rhodoferax sp. TBRC 17660]
MQGFAVGAAAPVGFAAREAKGRGAQSIEFDADAPQGRLAFESGRFVQAVNEDGVPVAVVGREFQKVARFEVRAPLLFGQCFEGRGLARTRVAQ